MLLIKNLTIVVQEPNGEKVLVDGLNLEIPEQRIVALVGGSGSGKTTTGLAILRLLARALKVKQGEIHYKKCDLLKVPEEHMRSLRGKDIGMVFQEPLNAFNPVFSIGYQIDEVLNYHTGMTPVQRKEKIRELLDIVGIKDPQRVAENYPHQLSGGMRQRAMIAQAIAAEPKLIIADEPTSNLDVTLQARIIELFKNLKKDLNISILLITHDLGMVEHMADDVAVLHKGKVVESGRTKDVMRDPKNDYTIKLMNVLKV